MRALSFLPALVGTQSTAERAKKLRHSFSLLCRFCTVFLIKSFLGLINNTSLSFCEFVNQPPEAPLYLLLYSRNP